MAQGFKGRIFCTPGHRDLCLLVLPDAGRLQEDEAERANRGGYSRHNPARALFTEEQALATLSRWSAVGYERPIPVGAGLEVEFIPTGHLLGAAYVRMRRADGTGGTVLFGGAWAATAGRSFRIRRRDPRPTCCSWNPPTATGSIPNDDENDKLAAIINETAAKRGKVIIPAFAIGGVEEGLDAVKKLEDAGKAPALPVYLDSPMALEALKFYQRHAGELDDDVAVRRGEVCAFCTARFTPVASAQESRAVVEREGPAIVISSSGMATGGRAASTPPKGWPIRIPCSSSDSRPPAPVVAS